MSITELRNAFRGPENEDSATLKREENGRSAVGNHCSFTFHFSCSGVSGQTTLLSFLPELTLRAVKLQCCGFPSHCSFPSQQTTFNMAQASSLRLLPKWRSFNNSPMCNRCLYSRRAMATQAAVPEQPFSELEQESSLVPVQSPDPRARNFDPLAFSKSRKRQLPPSRYLRFRLPIVAVQLTNTSQISIPKS